MNISIKPVTLSLDNPLAQDTRLTGGKGANLARLIRAGFQVPGARVVTVEAYHAWFNQLNTTLTFDKDSVQSDAQLETLCSELKEQLCKVSMPAELESALRAELGELCKTGSVSVRSSATLEDLPGASFAGQHDTYLGVNGIDDVIKSIRDCYVSLWEHRAIRYRLENELDTTELGMAVVVQQMVPAEQAGVAFSIHPITGDTQQVLINSAFGLGETVVSGESEIDQYTVNSDNEVIEKHIGEKEHALYLHNGATVSEVLSDSCKIRSSIGDNHCAAIADLARSAERYFGFPQDIEWAIADNQVYLLQSRPVSELHPLWTRQESAERFPGPVTPLTWDFTTGGFHESLDYSLQLMGLPGFKGKWFERFNGFVYGNQTAVEVYTAGKHIEFNSLQELEARLSDFRCEYAWVQELPSLWSTNLDSYLLQLGDLLSVNLNAMSAKSILEHLANVEKVGNEYFKPNIAISITQGLLHKTLYRLVALQCAEQAPVIYDNLTCYCETKTSRVNRDLYELYQLAKTNRELVKVMLNSDRELFYTKDKLQRFPEFSAAFHDFLKNHGHREIEFDAYHATWSGKPWIVLENLCLMLASENVPNPVERDNSLRSRQHRAELDFLAVLPASLTGFAKEIIQLCRTYTALDDIEHYHTTRLSVLFRRAVVSLGQQYVSAGHIDEPADLFFLQREMLNDLVEGSVTPKQLRHTVNCNKAEYVQQLETEPDYYYGDLAVSSNELPALSTANGGLAGLPGSPGIASGITCVIRSVEDFARFIPGSILVARTTNPAWTPLFYAASAVITESGGPLSHGAVTAREIGIPAVVAARGAIEALGDGSSVSVNGAAGKIDLLVA